MTLTIFDIENQFNKIVVAYKPELRKVGVARTVTGCLLASQLFYIRKTNGDKPICISDAEMAKAIGLSVKEVKGARKDITETGAFTYTLKGLPRKGFYDINPDFCARDLTEEEEGPREGEAQEPCPRQGLAISPERASSRAPEGSQSICIESSLREEAARPPTRAEAARAYREQTSAKVLEIYNANKPEPWAGKKSINKVTWDLIVFWTDELGDETFFNNLENALKQAKRDSWWGMQNLTLEALLRKTKTHLTELADKYDSNPKLVRGYSSSGNGSLGNAKRKKLTEFSYPPPPDLF